MKISVKTMTTSNKGSERGWSESGSNRKRGVEHYLYWVKWKEWEESLS